VDGICERPVIIVLIMQRPIALRRSSHWTTSVMSANVETVHGPERGFAVEKTTWSFCSDDGQTNSLDDDANGWC
jgi:hypothetical protein